MPSLKQPPIMSSEPTNINLDKLKQQLSVDVEKQEEEKVFPSQSIQTSSLNDIERTKAVMDAEPKMSIHLPCYPGEVPGKAFEPVTINGYRINIPKGVYVEVPRPFGLIAMEHYNVQMGDSTLGRSMRTDRDQVKDGVSVAQALL